MDAIVIEDVTKHFRKSTIQRHHTTFKTELIRWVRGQRRPEPQNFIQSLNGVSLRVPQGTTMGIVGRNGAGKSTLLKIITGIYSPTSGTVHVNGRISALLDLGAGFHPDFSGRENILINGIILGMSRGEIRARMQTIIDFSELGDFIDEPVRTYSSGMYMRLAFSVATHVDPDILLIDEILAVGDEHFSRKSRSKMSEFKRGGKTIVLVTHDLNTVQEWCDQAAWVDAGRIRSLGKPGEVVNEYRDAVNRADAQTVAGTLPDFTARSRLEIPGPAEDTNGTGAGPPLQVVRMRLLNQCNQEVSSLNANEALAISFDFVANPGIQNAAFFINIARSDGLKIYRTDSATECVPLPSPLPSFGTLCFMIEQLCLGDGAYTVEVTALAEGITGQSDKRISTFAVQSGLADAGVVRLPHRWSFESHQQGAAPELHSVTGS